MAADTWWRIAAGSGDKSFQIKPLEIDIGGEFRCKIFAQNAGKEQAVPGKQERENRTMNVSLWPRAFGKRRSKAFWNLWSYLRHEKVEID